MTTYYLAQYNVGRLHHPLDDQETAEFVAALEPINAIAEASPGFVWRLQDEGRWVVELRRGGGHR